MTDFQTPRGTRDLPPEEMRRRNWIVETLRKVYESYGFQPLETPAFEYWELLSRKGGGGDAIRDEIYYFKDKSGRELGLRFDLTVPLARFVATNPQLPKPFKRYQIGRVWRYDKPQAGRFREFWQADVDTVGSASMEADAECLAAVSDALKALGLKDFTIRMSNRKILNGVVKKLGLEKSAAAIFRALDKMEKVGRKETKKELEDISKDAGRVLEMIEGGFASLEKGMEGVKELEELVVACRRYGLKVEPDLSLVRGLDYYTGSIFEIGAGGGIGSIAGGGRYDKLIGMFGRQDVPAVGISIGIDRISELLKGRGFGRKGAYVAVVKEDFRKDAIRLVSALRESGIVAETDVSGKDLRKQLDYANSSGIPWVIFVGEKEAKSGKYTLRNMKTGKENKLSAERLLYFVKK